MAITPMGRGDAGIVTARATAALQVSPATRQEGQKAQVDPDGALRANASPEQLRAEEGRREQVLQAMLRSDGLPFAKVQYNIAARALAVRVPDLRSGTGPTSQQALQSVLERLASRPDAHGWIDHMHVVRNGTRPAYWHRPSAAE